jgi:hypothetical protein
MDPSHLGHMPADLERRKLQHLQESLLSAAPQQAALYCNTVLHLRVLSFTAHVRVLRYLSF